MEFAAEIAAHAVCLVLHSRAPLVCRGGRFSGGGEGAVHTKCRSVTREIRARLWPVVRFRQQKRCGLGWTQTVSPEKQINCVWTVTTALVPPVSAFRNVKLICNVRLILTRNKRVS